MDMLKILGIAFSAVLLAFYSGCTNASQTRILDGAQVYSIVIGKLSKGMSKDQVLHIIGRPQNIDNDYVWMWQWNGMPTASNNKMLDMSYGSGMFLLFDNEGRLLTSEPIKNSEGTPWTAFQNMFGYDRKKIKIMIGEPYPVRTQ